MLEELWLIEGKFSGNHAFYKGLIQVAGAFVHMQLHYNEPDHRIHGQRLNPAARLLRMGVIHTALYPNPHQSLNLDVLHQLCHTYLKSLEESYYSRNPWSPLEPPQLHLSV